MDGEVVGNENSISPSSSPSPSQILPAIPDREAVDMIDYFQEAMHIMDQGSMIFKLLSEEEKQAFRKAAREKYKPFSNIEGIWHPIYQEECVKINHERAYYRSQAPNL